jgi:hypothetical protein
MKKKIIVFLFLVLLAFLVFFAINTSASIYPPPKETAAEVGPWRVTHFDPRVRTVKFKTFVYLTPPSPVVFPGTGRGGYSKRVPSATAYIRSTESGGIPITTIKVSTKNLVSSFSEPIFYEVWTVDDDAGYAHSYGIFFSGMSGTASFDAIYNNYIATHSRVVITKKSFYDFSPLPGEIVLEGLIEKREPDIFEPQPKSSLMISNTIQTNII